MKQLIIRTSAVLFCLAMAANAYGQPLQIEGDPVPASDPGTSVSTFNFSLQPQLPTAGTVVIGKNFTIYPGRYADFKLPVNYFLDMAAKVGISILSGYSLDGTFIVPYFAAPGALYSAVDLIDGSEFAFSNQGGATVPVYGAHLVVRVYNHGQFPVQYKQLSVHWTGH